jgi:hypothetical protein
MSGNNYSQEQAVEGNSRDICQRVALLTKERGNLSTMHLKNLNVKIKDQEAIDRFKTINGSSPNHAQSIHTTLDSSLS